jgi:hypothetical protein
VREPLDHTDHDARGQTGIGGGDVRVDRERWGCKLDEPVLQCVELCAECLRELGLLEEDAMQAGGDRVQRDHRVDDSRQHAVKGSSRAKRLQVRLEHRGAVGEMLPGERYEDRVLIREVLIEGADRHVGPLGDAVGGACGVAEALEDLSSRLQDRLDGRLRSQLLGELSRLQEPIGNASRHGASNYSVYGYGEHALHRSHGLRRGAHRNARPRAPSSRSTVCSLTGVALLSPNVVTLAGVVLLTVALELHVRLIEEPYRLRAHSEQYSAYAARVGRFLPGVGRLRVGGKRAR